MDTLNFTSKNKKNILILKNLVLHFFTFCFLADEERRSIERRTLMYSKYIFYVIFKRKYETITCKTTLITAALSRYVPYVN